jgi:hypothetical protein
MPLTVVLVLGNGDEVYLFAVAEASDRLWWRKTPPSLVLLMFSVGMSAVVETCAAAQQLWALVDVFGAEWEQEEESSHERRCYFIAVFETVR